MSKGEDELFISLVEHFGSHRWRKKAYETCLAVKVGEYPAESQVLLW